MKTKFNLRQPSQQQEDGRSGTFRSLPSKLCLIQQGVIKYCLNEQTGFKSLLHNILVSFQASLFYTFVLLEFRKLDTLLALRQQF